ncbi:beta-galactosidase 8-like isoform X1 [Actinidia eriantha]|uniref:beta-galactosidase 8-like isoform X1 n=1 Tax=Actinidia eriantha TaxID=165200 RepID=UPI002584E883|nr:beta-galactosidase 8-like isoform X1 [Actinidia eriantha]
MFSVPFENLNDKQKVNPIIQSAYSDIIKSSANKKLEDISVDKARQLKDTFISFRGWSKGIAFVNDFNIGRFWPSLGPQCSLYVPAPILQHGENVVVILE